jgi:hypothetical protein
MQWLGSGQRLDRPAMPGSNRFPLVTTIRAIDQAEISREDLGMIPFYGNRECAYTPPRSEHDTVPEKIARP